MSARDPQSPPAKETQDRRDNLSRLRAKFVMKRIEPWRGEKWCKEAVTRIKSLPVQIRSQGLTVGLAVLLREGGPSVTIGNILGDWLLGSERDTFPVKVLAAPDGTKDCKALLRAVVAADRPSYLAAQREALGLLDELKLLADALYGGA